MLAFVNTEVAKAAGLVAEIDTLVKENPKLRAFVVLQKGAGEADAIRKLAAERKVGVPLTVPKDLQETLELYKLDPKARNTFLVYKGKTVRFNAVDVTPESFDKVAEAAKMAAE